MLFQGPSPRNTLFVCSKYTAQSPGGGQMLPNHKHGASKPKSPPQAPADTSTVSPVGTAPPGTPHASPPAAAATKAPAVHKMLHLECVPSPWGGDPEGAPAGHPAPRRPSCSPCLPSSSPPAPPASHIKPSDSARIQRAAS